MLNFYTYLWLRENGTPYYVGKGRDKRGFTNNGHSTHRPKHNARIFVQYWESEEKAFEMERWYISLFGRKDKSAGILRNLTDGGEGPAGLIHTEKSRATMSIFAQGNTRCMGRKYSEDTLHRMSEIQKGKPRGPHTTEHCQNISKAKLGVKKSEEARRNMVAAWEIRRRKTQ